MKFTLILVGVCFLAGVSLLLHGCKKPPTKQVSGTMKTNAPIYSDLRMQALTGSRIAFGLDPTSPAAPAWGVLMEIGYPEGTATLLSLSDGSASLYFSGGGGIIGGSGHETVRRAAKAFVRIAGQRQTSMRTTTMFPLPQAGSTVFYVLAGSGVFTTEADERELGGERHALSPLFYAGQEVITQLRFVSDVE